MTFADIQDEVITARFNAGQRASVKRWINYRYSWVWGHAEWPFKKLGPTNLSITAADQTPTPPADLHRVIRLWDDLGQPVRWLEPERFDLAYESHDYTGRPSDFKVVNGVLTVGPTPDASYTYHITYEKALTELSADGDEPAFPDRYHYLLVMGAISTGLKLENDPTWQPLEQEFIEAVSAMAEDLLPPDHTGNLQYGKDFLGQESWV